MGSIFQSAFLKSLGSGMSSSANDSGDDFTHITTPRHRGKGMTGANRTHQNLVAKSHIVDPNIVHELEDLKDKDSGISVLASPEKVQKIIKLYNLQNLDTEHPKTLGNTGIVIFFNPSMNRYCLKK